MHTAKPGAAPSLTMVVPALNEELLIEDFVRKSVDDLRRVTSDFEIILIDDGSTDETLPIASRLAKEYPELKVLSLGGNRGTGANLLPGFTAATKDYVFVNTVDAFFDTADLPGLIPHLGRADVVSGYRTDLKANNLYQKILTLGNYYLVRFLFGMNLRAFQTLQFHRRGFLSAVRLEARSSFLSPELLYKALKAGLTIQEVPVTFHGRKKGEAKGGGLKHVARSLRDIFRFWARWVVLGTGRAVQRRTRNTEYPS